MCVRRDPVYVRTVCDRSERKCVKVNPPGRLRCLELGQILSEDMLVRRSTIVHSHLHVRMRELKRPRVARFAPGTHVRCMLPSCAWAVRHSPTSGNGASRMHTHVACSAAAI